MNYITYINKLLSESETMTLNHLYYDLMNSSPQEGEVILDYGRGLFKKELPVIEVNPNTLKSMDGKTLVDKYKKAKAWQKKIVSMYVRTPSNYPVVIDGDKVVDGNHRVIAAILSGKDKIKAIQIKE